MRVEVKRSDTGSPPDEYFSDLDYWQEEYETWADQTDTATVTEVDTVDELLADLSYESFVVSKPSGYDLDVEWMVTVYDYYIE